MISFVGRRKIILYYKLHITEIHFLLIFRVREIKV